MRYEIVLTPDALGRITRVPADALSTVEAELENLAGDPEGLSRKSCFPHAPTGHLYHFRHYLSDSRWLVFTVFFVFGPSPQQITVADVTVSGVPS